jgi:hypothetical protein
MDGLQTWIAMGACFIFISCFLPSVLESNVKVVPHNFHSQNIHWF